MTTDAIAVGGVRLGVIATADGPRVAAEGPLEALATAINGYLDGQLPGLARSVRAGEPFAALGISVRPAPDGLEDDPVGQRWTAAGGTPNGDAVLVGSLSAPGVLVPRAVFLDALSRMLDLHAQVMEHALEPHPAPGPQPDEEPPQGGAGRPEILASLERRAAELDAWTARPRTADHLAEEAARRRVLLRELEVAGLLADADASAELADAPTLLAYHVAARSLLAYLRSEARRATLPGALDTGVFGAPVSIDFFRAGPRPDDAWTALGEWLLTTAEPTGAGGEFAAQAGGRWYAVRWRADDGTTPALLDLRQG